MIPCGWQNRQNNNAQLTMKTQSIIDFNMCMLKNTIFTAMFTAIIHICRHLNGMISLLCEQNQCLRMLWAETMKPNTCKSYISKTSCTSVVVTEHWEVGNKATKLKAKAAIKTCLKYVKTYF